MGTTGIGFDQLIESLEEARQSFLKHIDGVTDTQAVWKPYPGCKSIAETVDHLLWSEVTQLELVQSGKEPDYTSAPMSPPAESLPTLIAKLADAHKEFGAYLKSTYADKPVDTSINFWGHSLPLWKALTALAIEDSYHTGQAAYIRMASDPNYDYYAHIYGG